MKRFADLVSVKVTQCPKAERDLAPSVDLSDALTTAILVLTIIAEGTKDEVPPGAAGRWSILRYKMQGVGGVGSRTNSVRGHR